MLAPTFDSGATAGDRSRGFGNRPGVEREAASYRVKHAATAALLLVLLAPLFFWTLLFFRIIGWVDPTATSTGARSPPRLQPV